MILDVYKRQSSATVLDAFKCPVFSTASVSSVSSVSVSYTHLDVYKRQVLHCAQSGTPVERIIADIRNTASDRNI